MRNAMLLDKKRKTVLLKKYTLTPVYKKRKTVLLNKHNLTPLYKERKKVLLKTIL